MHDQIRALKVAWSGASQRRKAVYALGGLVASVSLTF
jgi:hypothetical protein